MRDYERDPDEWRDQQMEREQERRAQQKQVAAQFRDGTIGLCITCGKKLPYIDAFMGRYPCAACVEERRLEAAKAYPAAFAPEPEWRRDKVDE